MGEPAEPAPTAAVLLIGNELLSGKVRDENGYFLAGVLRRRGIRLLEIATVADQRAEIAAALQRLLARAPLVFTSGGVGPTHDDVTLDAVAHGTGRPLRRHPEMEALLRRHYGPSITAAALKMADLPEGTQLRALPGWPVLRLDLPAPPTERSRAAAARVYVLPGIPSLLRAKVESLERIEGELPARAAWTLLDVYTSLDESSLAGRLSELVAAFPDVEIGSYPRWLTDGSGRARVEVRVTLEASGPHAAQAQRARDALVAALDPAVLLPDREA